MLAYDVFSCQIGSKWMAFWSGLSESERSDAASEATRDAFVMLDYIFFEVCCRNESLPLSRAWMFGFNATTVPAVSGRAMS
jgi:hypothetical protein